MEIILLGKKFYHEKEVFLGKRVLSREGGSIIAKDILLWGGSSIMEKNVFFDKEVLLWKKSSTKKRKFYFAKRVYFKWGGSSGSSINHEKEVLLWKEFPCKKDFFGGKTQHIEALKQ